MNDLPCGTVTLVFTDIEGSTRLLAFLGSRYEEALASHRSLIREAFKSYGGVEVDTQGDALFYAFARARDAVEATVRAQRALEAHAWPEGHQVRVRIGVHSGEPQVTDEGYVGEDVHIGARIASAAYGGQVLLSDATERLLPGSIKGIGLRDLGQHGLKDLATKQHLYQLVIEGLTNDFPPIRTLDARPNNLPRQLGALIGRDDEVEKACSLLRRDSTGILTLTGPGGTGKTRLALQVARKLLDDFPHGVFLVDLSSVTDPSLVVPSIAGALSIRESPGRTLQEALEDYLTGKQMLLVIDNFEQVMEAAAEVASLLVSAAGLKMLITSREPLHVQGEQEFPVLPLDVPTAGTREQVASAPAVILFVERAEAVKPGFDVTHDNATAVAEICRRLDGLPLAIELAAARTKLLSPDALLGRLDQSLTVLSSGRRDASKRQRTLRGAISWSYDLLSEGEQRLFRRLGVFAGGWSLEAAEEVCDRGDLELGVLDGLAFLLDKSLVRAVEGDGDRFTMLRTIREFALERLEESGEAEDIRRAHADFFRELAQAAEPHLIGAEERRWLDELEDGHDNLRAAVRWALEHDADAALVLVSGIWRLWWARGHLTEGRGWLEAALRHAGARSAVRAQALRAVCFIAHSQGDRPAARRAAEEAREVSASIGDRSGVARALDALSGIAQDDGDLGTAATHAHQSRELYEELGEREGVAVTTGNLGNIALIQGDFVRAARLAEESLQIHREHGYKEGMAASELNIGFAALELGELERADSSFVRALELSRDLNHRELEFFALEALAASAARGGRSGEAGELLARAEALRGVSGFARERYEQNLYERTKALIDSSTTPVHE